MEGNKNSLRRSCAVVQENKYQLQLSVFRKSDFFQRSIKYFILRRE